MENLEFGYKCKDIITGFEGILKTRASFITACDRVELVNNNEIEGRWFDAPTIKILDEGIYKDLQEIKQCNLYNDIEEALYEFGVLAKDVITDYEGKIITKSIGISGDISYGLSPKYAKESNNNDGVMFDEGRIKVIDDKKDEIKTSEKRTGGVVPNFKFR